MRMMGRISFRANHHNSETDAGINLGLPQDSLRRRPSQREEIHLVRKALKNKSSRRIVGRHAIEDGSSLTDNNVYNRHLSARRISHLMLMGQQTDAGVGNLERKSTRQFNRDEADDVVLGNLQRLGSETVLRRYNEKRRTLSAASSDYDPTYSNLNEMRGGGINITRTSSPMAEVHQTENVDVESSTSTSTTSTTKSAVERKKITSGTGVGRRKLTPHPLNPNNVMGSQAESTSTAETKLGVLAESEDQNDVDTKE